MLPRLDGTWMPAHSSPAPGCGEELLKKGRKRDLIDRRNLEELIVFARNENARAGTVIGGNDANIPDSRGFHQDAE